MSQSGNRSEFIDQLLGTLMQGYEARFFYRPNNDALEIRLEPIMGNPLEFYARTISLDDFVLADDRDRRLALHLSLLLSNAKAHRHRLGIVSEQ